MFRQGGLKFLVRLFLIVALVSESVHAKPRHPRARPEDPTRISYPHRAPKKTFDPHGSTIICIPILERFRALPDTGKLLVAALSGAALTAGAFMGGSLLHEEDEYANVEIDADYERRDRRGKILSDAADEIVTELQTNNRHAVPLYHLLRSKAENNYLVQWEARDRGVPLTSHEEFSKLPLYPWHKSDEDKKRVVWKRVSKVIRFLLEGYDQQHKERFDQPADQDWLKNEFLRDLKNESDIRSAMSHLERPLIYNGGMPAISLYEAPESLPRLTLDTESLRRLVLRQKGDYFYKAEADTTPDFERYLHSSPPRDPYGHFIDIDQIMNANLQDLLKAKKLTKADPPITYRQALTLLLGEEWAKRHLQPQSSATIPEQPKL